MIQGWDEGILGSPDVPAMKEGGKRRLVLPPGASGGLRWGAGVV